MVREFSLASFKPLPAVKFNFHYECNFADLSDCSTEGPIMSPGLIILGTHSCKQFMRGEKVGVL